MTNKKTNNRLAAWRAFLQAHTSVIRSLEREMEETHGLPLTWYDVLLNLKNTPDGRLRMQALADSIVLTRSGLTRLVDRMEKAGYVRRQVCPEDHRGFFAVITPKGLNAQKRAAIVHLKGIRDHFTRHLTDSDLDALNATLSKVVKANRG